MAKRNTRQELIDSALAYVDANGLDALTLRTLGAELGLHHTALYRHFASKEDLLESIFTSLLADAVASIPDDIDEPRERVVVLCVALRGVFARHPGLSAAIVQGAGMLDQSVDIQRMALASLRDMGVSDSSLGLAYQAIESYVLGSSLYDFANAPQHVAERAQRYRHIGDSALAPHGESDAVTAAHTEAAFIWGLHALLDGSLRA